MDQLLLPLMLAGVFGLLIYSSNRTRKRQAKAAQELKENLVPGRQVMTGSGLFGTVVSVDEEAVVLETSPGIESRWLLAAVAKIVEPPVDADDEFEDDEEYEDDEYEDEYEDDEEYEDEDGADAETSDELEVDVPDDASSLTTDPGEDDAPRR
ncbi:preprotein translocase subunit YajC [Actinotalea sp.]|uniref:preprotein translocase subunit YajC n=1 Tax=Actinotalea sp. TaxID=1872145 RepID=UPI003565387C